MVSPRSEAKAASLLTCSRGAQVAQLTGNVRVRRDIAATPYHIQSETTSWTVLSSLLTGGQVCPYIEAEEAYQYEEGLMKRSSEVGKLSI